MGQIGMFVDNRDAMGSQAAECSVELVGAQGRNWDPSGGDHSGSCHNCSHDKKGGYTWVSQDQRWDTVCYAVSLQSGQALVKSRNRNCGWLGRKLAVNYWKRNSPPGRCREARWEVIRICRVRNLNFFFPKCWTITEQVPRGLQTKLKVITFSGKEHYCHEKCLRSYYQERKL